MMKKVLVAIMILVCCMSLFACTDNTADNTVKKNISLAQIKDRIIDECAIEDAMDLDAYMLLNLYGIEEADVAESACFSTLGAVFPDEIIMIKAKDKDALNRISEKLENRLDAVLAQSKNYDAENYEIAQKCKLITKDEYIALFISPKHEQMQEIYLGEL